MGNAPFEFRDLYRSFDAPCTDLDCGMLCAPHNPSGKPFCCDVCKAVPVAYKSEWAFLKQNSTLWHRWRGSECREEPVDRKELESQTPAHLTLLACKGPQSCERGFRAVSCRQFPFFPYITPDFRFIGITYDWDFTGVCWVLSHLDRVTLKYRREFIAAFDQIFSTWLEDFDSYAQLSEEMREHFASNRKRFPLMHRNGQDYLVSPRSGRLERCTLSHLSAFGPYKEIAHL
jgi:hypothetical protein